MDKFLGLMVKISFKYGLLLTGIVLLIATFVVFVNTIEFLSNTSITKGKVIEIVSDNRVDETYRAMIEFEDEAGSSVRFISCVGSEFPAFEIGEAVEVIYPKSSSEQAKINDFAHVWGLNIVLAFMGLGFSIAGVFLYRLSKDLWAK